MKFTDSFKRRRALAAFCSAAFLCQAGSCQFNDITTSVTLSGRDVFLTLFRDAILGPIDTYVTEAIDDFFDDGNN